MGGKMEALTLSSPMIIEVVGLPGSGKSFFATQFANTFGSALVSEDKIRWTLFAHHTYSESENAMVKQVADLMITELLRSGKTFVCDGGYNSKITREELAARAKKAGFRVLTIVVQTDEPTAQRRAVKRDPKKHGDQYKQSLTASEFANQKKQYQAPNIDRDAVVISGKHTYATQARIVLKKIVETQGSRPAAAETRPTPIVRSRGPFIQ
jgi:predicted kinase